MMRLSFKMAQAKSATRVQVLCNHRTTNKSFSKRHTLHLRRSKKFLQNRQGIERPISDNHSHSSYLSGSLAAKTISLILGADEEQVGLRHEDILNLHLGKLVEILPHTKLNLFNSNRFRLPSSWRWPFPSNMTTPSPSPKR